VVGCNVEGRKREGPLSSSQLGRLRAGRELPRAGRARGPGRNEGRAPLQVLPGREVVDKEEIADRETCAVSAGGAEGAAAAA
jgi:hypothetical protein